MPWKECHVVDERSRFVGRTSPVPRSAPCTPYSIATASSGTAAAGRALRPGIRLERIAARPSRAKRPA
jgi:hypothetical protein